MAKRNLDEGQQEQVIARPGGICPKLWPAPGYAKPQDFTMISGSEFRGIF